MAKLIKLEKPQQKEARLVAGIHCGDKSAEFELYSYCADYYHNTYRALFSAPKDAVEEILQDSFIKFWENIECGKIYAEESVVKGKDSKPLSGSIRTYFMSIARYKYLEWLRENPQHANSETEWVKQIREKGFDDREVTSMLYDDDDNIQLELIAYTISHMSERCSEILSKFYYEDKDLDRILEEIPSIESKNALKTKKHKCMETLREVVSKAYERYLQYN